MLRGKELFCVMATLMVAIIVLWNEYGRRGIRTILQPMNVTKNAVIQQNRSTNGTAQSTLSKCYVTVYKNGRTGNLLYELFSLVGIASTLNCTPLLEVGMSRELGRLVDINIMKIVEPTVNYNWTIFSEQSPLRYDDRVQLLNQKCNWKLKGFFQSWRYFKTTERYIRKEFKFKQHLVLKAKSYLKNYTCRDESDNCLNIAIHVRRGDVLSAFYLQYGYEDIPVSYLNKAMTYFRKQFTQNELHFVVASDDIQWCKTNINGTNVHFSTMRTAEEDVVLLSSCDHAIITVGSYGRIVGFLTGGEVIYYRDFPRPGSQMFNKTNMTDIYPDHWISLK